MFIGARTIHGLLYLFYDHEDDREDDDVEGLHFEGYET